MTEAAAVSPPTPMAGSGIFIPVEVPVGVKRLRDRMDPSAARGVPAHITLLDPFMPRGSISAAIIERVRQIVADEPTFPFTLAGVGRWRNVVYLAPEPAEPFSRLTSALAAAFPEYPPYGGAFDVVVPHLTIAADAPESYLAAAEHALPQMLPFRAVAREAWLIGHEPASGSAILARFPLATARDR
jgi:2'-5' RNA ligase